MFVVCRWLGTLGGEMKGGKKGDPKYVPSSSDIATIMQLSPPPPLLPTLKTT